VSDRSSKVRATGLGVRAPSRGGEPQRKLQFGRSETNDRPDQSVPRDWDTVSIAALWWRFNRERSTPQTTVEAIIVAVKAGGVAALKEPSNIERLARCDTAARSQINVRIAGLDAARGTE
jgi:hypothetical protein